MTNNEPHHGALATAINGTAKLLGGLPPAFLVLCLINLAFLAGAGWFMDRQFEQRSAMANRIIDACLEHRLQFKP